MAFTYLNEVTAASLLGSGAGLTNLPGGVPMGTIALSVNQPDSTFLPCDGSILDQASYPDLYAEIGQLPQPGAAAFHFNVPHGAPTKIKVVNNLVFSLSTSNFLAYSSDSGDTWTTVAVGVVGHMDIAWTGSRYVVIGTDKLVYWSTNLSTWTAATTQPSAVPTWTQLLWNGSSLVLFGNTSYTATSTDGTTWTSTSSSGPGTTTILDLDFNGTTYVALISNTIKTATSPTGTWTTAASITGVKNVTWIASLNLFVLTGSTPNLVYTSPDGTTWTQRTSGVNTYADYGKPFWTGTKVVMASTGWALSYFRQNHVLGSSDGITWAVEFDLTHVWYTTWQKIQPTQVVFHSGIYLVVATTSTPADNWMVSARTWSPATHFRVPHLEAPRDASGTQYWIKALTG